jgi:hypothetical protein
LNLSAVRGALADALENVANDQGVQVSAYALAQPTPPGLQIIPPGVQYDQAMHRGLDTWIFIVQGFVALTTDVGSQVTLDQMCAPSGPGSVKAALEADKTLGGVVQDLHVLEQSPGRVADYAGVSPMLLVEWRVQIYALGS